MRENMFVFILCCIVYYIVLKRGVKVSLNLLFHILGLI